MDDIGERIARLSPEKRALLEKYLMERIAKEPKKQNIPERGTLDPCPLSYAQQRLWFLDQLEPNSSVYNISKVIRINGNLRVEVLHKALNTIVERHEALRTTFSAIDGDPIQVINENWNLELPVINLENLLDLDREEKIHQIIDEQINRPFHLSKDLMLRSTLLRLSKDEHILILVMHHIASDGWSMGIFNRELSALYGAYLNNKPSPLPPLPIQYADFAIWQRKWMEDKVLKNQLSYWKDKLKNAPAKIDLPIDHPRPAIQTYSGSKISLEISNEILEKLKRLSRKNNCTLFMTLLAAYNVLLYRYSGQEDIVIGTPIANRNQLEIENLIGFFVNTLPMRINLSGNPTFCQLLNQTRELALEAYANQDLPFEKLVEEIQAERDMSGNPVFQIVFAMQNAPKSKFELSELKVNEIKFDNGKVAFDLVLSINENDQSLTCSWEYNTDLFSRDTIERISIHYKNLLEAIVANPDQRISQMPIMDEKETNRLLFEWQGPDADFPLDKCAHNLIEAQAKKRPDAPALEFLGKQLTYRELDIYGNQLANFLKGFGVKPDVMVGLFVERSLEMITGILGILKAGGAYVPIDPDYPEEQINFILQDTQLSVILTQARFKSKLEKIKIQIPHIICLDTQWSNIALEPEGNPESNVKPENLAYVIYTSGTTGKPKGTMIQHNSLVNFVQGANTQFDIGPSDRVLQFASLTFDGAVEEIFPGLANGATLVLRTKNMLDSIDQFIKECDQLKLTTLFLPTAYWHELISTMERDSLKLPESVKMVAIGGERALKENYTKWMNYIGPKVKLINAYGPTEATVAVTICNLSEYETFRELNEVPIGRPIPGVRLYLLDKNMQLVPTGVHGELYIGGVCLARGYLNQSDLTIQNFINNPFGLNSGDKLYKTGDKVRYLPNGNIEFVGRVDNQVKIRGHRIELDGITEILSQHPGVKEAVVIVREDVPGDKRLVAYLAGLQELETSNLRAFLKEKLPDYMIPSTFIVMDSLPKTTSGKIDRRALPGPAISSSTVEPQTELERELAKIWSEVLRLEKVGIHDNFFEIGGDSILSIQIVAKANKAGIKITPRQIFLNQTIAELARVASTRKNIKSENEIVTGFLPLTPIQHWFFQQNFPVPDHFNMSYLFKVSPDTKEDIIEKVLKNLLLHHDALRMRFTKDSSGWHQYNEGPDDKLPFNVIDLASLTPEEQILSIASYASKCQSSLNLKEGPLIKVIYFKLGQGKPGRLLFVVHHLVVDGVSWRILLEDFSALYKQIDNCEAPKLPSKTTSYKSWSQWLDNYAKSESLLNEIQYWINLPWKSVKNQKIKKPKSQKSGESLQITVSLSSEETNILLKEAPGYYKVQINDIFLAALSQAFGDWMNKGGILIDLEGHGREELAEEIDITRTVGWFTSIFPVILYKKKNLPLLESIKPIMDDIPNKGIGYGVLRYLSQNPLAEKLKKLPRAQVSFNYLGQYDQIINRFPLMGLGEESKGTDINPGCRTQYLIEIIGLVIEDCLKFRWKYKEISGDIVQNLSQNFIKALQSIIQHCKSRDKVYRTSDFPDVDLTQEGLDNILDQINQADDEV